MNMALIKKNKTFLLFLAVSVSAIQFIFSGCTGVAKRYSVVRINSTNEIDESSLPVVTNLYGEATSYLEKGLSAAEKEDWKSSHLFLEKALDVLVQINFKEDTDPEVIKAVTVLHSKVIDTYQYVLPHVTSLQKEASMETVEKKLENDLERLYADTLPDTAVTEIIADTIVYDIPLVYNRRVSNCIKFFTTTGRKPFRLWMQRKGRYQDMIRSKLKKAGLPQNLLYQAMIESGFNHNAYSRSHAAGIWQFIPTTGVNYGLRRDWWIDERYDPEKATDAAIAYLKKLYDMFGDWYLAMAGYNAGEYRIQKALRLSNYNDFWNLPRRSIREETRNYVPKMIAATIVCSQPENYGFDSLEVYAPFQYDTVIINGCISLDTLARCAGVNVDSLFYLNPSLKRRYVPPHIKNFVLRIPKNTLNRFKQNYNKLNSDSFVSWKFHTVGERENLTALAKKYHTSVKILKAVNSLRSNRLKKGTALIVPGKGKNPLRSVVTQQAMTKTQRRRGGWYERYAFSGRTKAIHRIRSGEFLGKIARRYGVTVSQLRRWNHLGYRSRIYAGKKLVVYIGRSSARHSLKRKRRSYNSNNFHVVGRGESLWNIARMFNVSVKDIAKWNNLKNLSKIKAGEKLIIKKADSSQKKKGHKKVLYEVRSGDTISGIAANFNLKVKDVLKWNNLTSKSIIRHGKLITLWIEAH